MSVMADDLPPKALSQSWLRSVPSRAIGKSNDTKDPPLKREFVESINIVENPHHMLRRVYQVTQPEVSADICDEKTGKM
jgi:hypothetical protein